jgi:hypothetical protein
MAKFILGLGLLVAACGGSDDAPVECEISDRGGTYLFHLAERGGGTCGAIPDALQRFDSQEPSAGCALDEPDRWSENDCKLERSYSCDEPAIETGATSKTVAVTTQQDGGGAKITGLVTIRIFRPNGTVGCASTYDLTATRQ